MKLYVFERSPDALVTVRDPVVVLEEAEARETPRKLVLERQIEAVGSGTAGYISREYFSKPAGGSKVVYGTFRTAYLDRHEALCKFFARCLILRDECEARLDSLDKIMRQIDRMNSR